MALVLHEARALERKTEKGKLFVESVIIAEDGHFRLGSDSSKLSNDALYYHTKDVK